MADLNDNDANKLFNEISQAMREDDSTKLSELTQEQALEELEEEQPLEKDRTDEEDDSNKESGDDEGDGKGPQDEEDDLADKADKEDKTKAEPDTELVKLREQLEKLNKENHALRSQAGRVPYVQRRLREIDKKLEEVAKSHASPSGQVTTELQSKIDAALQGIKKDDADLADGVAKAIMEAISGVTNASHTKEVETLKFLREQEAKAYQQEQLDILLEQYPNAPEVFRSPHWSSWKEKQSSAVQQLADSNTADDVIFAFQKYAKDMVREHPELEDKKSDTVVDEEAEAKAKKIEEERLRKKNSAADVRSKAGAGKVSMPDDPEALFKKYSDELRKQRTGT